MDHVIKGQLGSSSMPQFTW